MFRDRANRVLIVLALAVAAAGVAACDGHQTAMTTPTASTPLAAAASATSGVMAGATSSSTVVGVLGSGGRDGHSPDDHRGSDKADDHRGPGNQGTAELNGPIVAGSLAGSCAGHNLSFMVGSTKVTTNAATQFKDGACESLAGGSQVEVKGTRQSDGSILAASIESDRENENDDPERDFELNGTIAAGSIGGSCAANSLSFTVGATMVKTNAATQFKDASCAALKAGDSVEVKGTRQTDASVLASRVELER